MTYRRLMMKQRATCNRETGSAALELALLAPLMMLMLLGAIDFGRLFYQGIAVANAARAGLQYGTQHESNSGDLAGIEQAARDDAEDLEGVSVVAQRYCECPGGSPVNCDTTCGFGESPRVYVKVTVEKTFETLFPYPGIPHTVNLRHQAVMRAQ